jgi:hypothetical protein
MIFQRDILSIMPASLRLIFRTIQAGSYGQLAYEDNTIGIWRSDLLDYVLLIELRKIRQRLVDSLTDVLLWLVDAYDLWLS